MKQFFTLIISSFLILNCFGQEICNNGIDDDGDLLIDLNDTDCACNQAVVGNPTSIIPNPSFENLDCCPSNFSELGCASQWGQATSATSDYFNTCDFMGPYGVAPFLPYPDGNGAAGMLVQTGWSEYLGACLTNPMISGTQYTLQMDVLMTGYVLDANFDWIACDYNTNQTSLDFVIFGHSSCSNLPLSTYDCPLTFGIGYVQLGTASIDLQTIGFQTITFNFTPTFDVNEIIIGPPCAYPAGWSNNAIADQTSECVPYVLADNLVLNTSSSFSTLTLSTQGSFCTSNMDLVATAGSSGGVFQWYENGIALLGEINNTLNVSTQNLSAGTYQVTYTLNGDCYFDSITLSGSSSSLLTVNDAIICQGESAELSVFGGDTYNWTPNNALSATSGSIVDASPSQTTSYTVSSTDVNGCVSQATSVVTVLLGPTDLEIMISPNNVETEATLTVNPPQYDYTWTTPEGESIDGNSLLYQFPEGEANYLFVVQAMNDLGCTASQNVTITISQDLIVYVPNSFSPDFDEFNGTFYPVVSDNIDNQAYTFLIFNRWGEILFESHDLTIGWDGTYDGNLVQAGAYSWTVELKLKNQDDRRVFSGHVNVLR